MIVAGVDECGRGPLAGPVVAAAVILNPSQPIFGLADSKKISAKKRAFLEAQIKSKCLAWAVACAKVEEIDEINILQASLLAMKRAIVDLSTQPDYVLIDGNQIPQGLVVKAQAIVKGDMSEPAISAASILAKEYRDRLMVAYDFQYPMYGFAAHKGYPTKIHREALLIYGASCLHRRSFAPVARAIANRH